MIPEGMTFHRYVTLRISAAFRAAQNEPAVRSVIGRSRKPDSTPHDWFTGLDDETWFWMNTSGRRHHESIARLVPGLPAAALQDTYTGQHGDATLGEGFNAYKLFKRCYEKYAPPLAPSTRVLDFGCGWGRLIRFFLKDIDPQNLNGIDQSEDGIRACRETNRWCKFLLIEPNAPTQLEAGSFDLTYLYSVFSHQPEDMHWSWLKEFQRILRPGGVLIATARARDFIQFCQQLRDDPRLDSKPDRLKMSANAFLESKAALARYDAGEFSHSSYAYDGRWSFGGETCIPRAYVERRWKELFYICDYIDDPKACAQSVIVVRKPS